MAWGTGNWGGREVCCVALAPTWTLRNSCTLTPPPWHTKVLHGREGRGGEGRGREARTWRWPA